MCATSDLQTEMMVAGIGKNHHQLQHLQRTVFERTFVIYEKFMLPAE